MEKPGGKEEYVDVHGLNQSGVKHSLGPFASEPAVQKNGVLFGSIPIF